jgi:hypothetical protein
VSSEGSEECQQQQTEEVEREKINKIPR